MRSVAFAIALLKHGTNQRDQNCLRKPCDKRNERPAREISRPEAERVKAVKKMSSKVRFVRLSITFGLLKVSFL